MKDENTKEREEHIIELVSSFCDDNLNDEYKELCIKLVKKLARKHDVPFKRGKVEIWASAIVYAIGQINFLFDKSFEPYKTPDDICSYFNTKKSTVSNKAHDIREMCDLGHFDEEFSTCDTMESLPTFTFDENGFMVAHTPMDDYLDEAYELFDDGKIDEAISMLDDIDKDNHEYEKALFFKSFFLNASGTKDESSEAFNAFLSEFNENVDIKSIVNGEIDENNPEELFQEALFHNNIGNYDKAIHYYDLYLKILPNQTEVLNKKANVLIELKEYKEALDVIDKALKIDSKNDELWTTKGITLYQLHKNKKSMKCLDKALKINPNNSTALSQKGIIYFERNQYKSAIKCYDKAIEIDPEEIILYTNLANMYMDLDDNEKVEKCFSEAEKINPKDIGLLCEKGEYFLMEERFEEAIECYDKCLEIDSKNVDALLHKSMALAQLDREDDFEECMAKIMMINPLLLADLEEEFR